MNWDGNGNHYIQSQRPSQIDLGSGVITTYAPEGERIYTDAEGNVLPRVVIPGSQNIYLDENDVWRQSPDTIIAQTVPEGDPLPNNQNKG